MLLRQCNDAVHTILSAASAPWSRSTVSHVARLRVVAADHVGDAPGVVVELHTVHSAVLIRRHPACSADGVALPAGAGGRSDVLSRRLLVTEHASDDRGGCFLKHVTDCGCAAVEDGDAESVHA